MGYIGGRLQEAFVQRIRELDRDRLLAVPIDVGKHTAMAVVCDFWGKVVVSPFTFSFPFHPKDVSNTPDDSCRARAKSSGNTVYP